MHPLQKILQEILETSDMEFEIFRKIELGILIYGGEQTFRRWIKRYLINKYGEKEFVKQWKKVMNKK
jgi:hypothetical protein